MSMNWSRAQRYIPMVYNLDFRLYVYYRHYFAGRRRRRNYSQYRFNKRINIRFGLFCVYASECLCICG